MPICPTPLGWLFLPLWLALLAAAMLLYGLSFMLTTPGFLLGCAAEKILGWLR